MRFTSENGKFSTEFLCEKMCGFGQILGDFESKTSGHPVVDHTDAVFHHLQAAACRRRPPNAVLTHNGKAGVHK